MEIGEQSAGYFNEELRVRKQCLGMKEMGDSELGVIN